MSDRKFANTLARGLSVLRAFRISDDGLSHSDLVARTGLAPATVTRLTYTLCEIGYLSQRGGLFRLGPATLALASVAYAATSFVDLADVPMKDLANRTRTLVVMAVRDGSSMSLVRTWRPEGVASLWLEPGNRVPIAQSSSGQAFVAALSPERFAALEPDAKLRAIRERGIEQLASRGFTFVSSDERFSPTINAAARPFYASDLGAPVVFAAGAVPDDLTDARLMEEVGPALRDVVIGLERATGFPLTIDRSA